MNILITGGTGFLGSHTATRLKNLNNNVSIIGRDKLKAQALIAKGINFHKVDIRNIEELNKVFDCIDVVIHCAAIASPYGKWEQFRSINIDGTKNIVNMCIKYKVKRLINISTPSVYFDYTNRTNIKESDPLPKAQVSFYGQSKLIADSFIKESVNKEKLHIVSLRPRAIFGIGDKTITPRIMNSKILGKVPLINKGNALHDITYIDNVVDAIILAIESDNKTNGQIYNITNDKPLQIDKIFELFHKSFNIHYRTMFINYRLISTIAFITESIFKIFQIKREPKLTRLGVGLFAHSQTLDIQKAKDELGYMPKVSIEEGIKRVASARKS